MLGDSVRSADIEPVAPSAAHPYTDVKETGYTPVAPDESRQVFHGPFAYRTVTGNYSPHFALVVLFQVHLLAFLAQWKCAIP
jgi:hypothetical protein